MGDWIGRRVLAVSLISDGANGDDCNNNEACSVFMLCFCVLVLTASPTYDAVERQSAPRRQDLSRSARTWNSWRVDYGNKAKIERRDDLNESKKKLLFCIIGSESNI